VLPDSIHAGVAERDYDSLWKILALLGGEETLMSWWDVDSDLSNNKEIKRSLASTLLRKSWMAMQKWEVNQFSAGEIVDRYFRLIEAELHREEFNHRKIMDEERGGIEAVPDYEDNLKALFSSLNIQINSPTNIPKLPEVKVAAEHTTEELRNLGLLNSAAEKEED
jgi:hypothetical protein